MIIRFFTLILTLITLGSKAQTLSLKLDKTQSINYQRTFLFNIEYKVADKTYSTNSDDKKHRIKWSKLKVKVKNGTFLNQGIIKIDPLNVSTEFNSVSLSVEHKKNGFKLDTIIPLNYSGLEIINFNANDGKEVKNGIRLHLLSKIISEITNTDVEPTASNGKNGKNGKNGPSVQVILELKTINEKKLLVITCTNPSQQKFKSVYIDPEHGQAKLMAMGGTPSQGAKGEVLRKENGKLEVGKNGLNGQPGIDGHFDVFVTKKTFPYLKNIQFQTSNRHHLSIKPMIKKGSIQDSKLNTKNDGEVHVYFIKN